MARPDPRDPEAFRRRIRKEPRPVASTPAGRDIVRAFVGLGLLVAFGLLGWFGWWYFFTGSWNALRKHVPEYVDLTNANPQAAASPMKKFVVVDVSRRDLDPLHYDLPRPIRAEGPDEVTTIVQVRRSGTVVGTYSGGTGVATKWTFHVRVVDRATKRVLDAKTFEGGDPPSSIRRRRSSWSSGEGDKPIGTVLYYLEGLAGRSS